MESKARDIDRSVHPSNPRSSSHQAHNLIQCWLAKLMVIKDLDTLSRDLLNRAANTNFNLHGPAEIEYGFGWEPTVTFWTGYRRIHFYFDARTAQDGLTVEVANKGTTKATSKVMRGLIKTYNEAWSIVDYFLRQHRSFDNLPDYDWKIDGLDHDKFIPHPPDSSNPTNIVEFLANPHSTQWIAPDNPQVLLITCLAELQEYHKLYTALYATLEPLIQIKPSGTISDSFKPTQSTVLEVIKYHPKDEFLLPPAAWVYPRKGQFEYKTQTWEYTLHGGGLSFFDNQSPPSDISIEFSRQGHIALTAHTFQCYLDTVSLRKNEPIYRKILRRHEALLDELVKLGHLISVTPILIQDDQTFILAGDS